MVKENETRFKEFRAFNTKSKINPKEIIIDFNIYPRKKLRVNEKAKNIALKKAKI
jgi:hypothetical protein